jgi:regulator of sigma E protease
MITTVLAFLLTLGVLIVIHEYGHYRVAVACGVKVLRFSVGFGRVVWSRRWGPDGTEFTLSALPLGGYVRMLDEREGEVPEHERHRAFNRQPLKKRAAIVAAGPLANLALAVLLYAGSHWIGIEEPKAVLSAPAAGTPAEQAGLRAGDWVRSVRAGEAGEWTELHSMADLRWQATRAAMNRQDLELEVTARDGRERRSLTLPLAGFDPREVDSGFLRRVGLAGSFSEPVLGEVMADGPAAKAGLQRGDRVLAIDGRPVVEALAVVEAVRAAVERGADGAERPRTLAFSIERDGRTLALDVTPRLVRQDTREGPRTLGRIDAQPGQPPERVLVRHGPIDGLVLGAERTWEVSVLTVRMLGRMLIGEASLKNLSGPITIADYAGQSVQQGLAFYLGFLALVSVSLGVLNLLPLPMLDGGHLMYYIFEGVTGRPVSDAWLARLQRGGIVVLLAMMSVALFNDMARLLGLH